MYPAHYQLTSKLLQVTVSPDAYRALPAKYRRGQLVTRFSKYLAGPDYWDSLPTYLIARCPFCAAAYTAKVDTYSLAGWAPHHELYRDVYCEDYQHVGCEHFVGVQTFVNLQGQMPTKLAYYSSYLDVHPHRPQGKLKIFAVHAKRRPRGASLLCATGVQSNVRIHHDREYRQRDS
jgi:hypothetical protein